MKIFKYLSILWLLSANQIIMTTAVELPDVSEFEKCSVEDVTARAIIRRNLPDDNARKMIDDLLIDGIKAGDLRTVRVAISQGAAPNLKNKTTKKLLIESAIAENPNPAIVRELRWYRAQIPKILTEAQQKEVNDLLIASSSVGNLTMITEALSQGAEPNIFSPTGHTPLLYAVHSASTRPDHLKKIKMLLDAHADVNMPDQKTKTSPLIFAAGSQIPAALGVTEMLLKAGANIDNRNIRGFTALMATQHHPTTDLPKLLLKAGATPDPSHPDTATRGAHNDTLVKRAMAELELERAAIGRARI